MRFIFKTKYSQDINIAKHNGDRFWYSLLILIMVALPLVLDDFYLGEISYICILSIAGIGLMILSGCKTSVSGQNHETNSSNG